AVPASKPLSQRTSVLSQLNSNRVTTYAASTSTVAKRESVADIRSSQAASRTRPFRVSSEGGAPNNASPSIQDSSAAFDELINIHRQHLRLFAELSKAESKLIVNYSMKLKPDPSLSNEAYVKELEGILAQKEQSIRQLQLQIQRCKGGK
ncbi:hypothetical protein BC830DRAFT_539572, partial [Chytriomyces sp. MP71]